MDDGSARKRKRITRACDRCKRRKIKCTGLLPCEFCNRAGESCTYDTLYSRGKAPPIAPAFEHSPCLQDEGSGQPLGQNQYGLPRPSAVSSQRTVPVSSGQVPSTTSPAAPASTATSHVSPQAGLHGRYIGPTSGVSFLQRVQQRLGHAESFSNPDDIFTFGDAPLDGLGAGPISFMMLPKEVAQRFLDRYFDFGMPTYRFLHRPTIQAWLTELYETFGAMHDAPQAPAKVALVLMVLAHGRVYMPDADRVGPADLSQRLYQAADQQLAKESGPIRLTSIQARLTQCYYLLTQSHINHCWRAFGSVSHLTLAMGLNRSRKIRAPSNMSNVETECRRRTFWCAYALDVHLSLVLGRPQLFHDDDIDVELPLCIDDESLSHHQTEEAAAESGPSIMLGAIAHIKLSRIVKRILRQLYPLTPISADERQRLTDQLYLSLAEWRSDLQGFLDMDKFNPSMFLPIVQRQRNVLNLTYWHAHILMYRPFLLQNFTSRQDTRATLDDALPADAQSTESAVQQCISAAMNTVNAINQMTKSRQISRAFWIAAYFAFTASVVLYIHVIRRRSGPSEAYSDYLSAATQCQSHIASIADKGSLPERYLLLLEELRVEALRQTDAGRPSTERPKSLAADTGLDERVRQPLTSDRAIAPIDSLELHDPASAGQPVIPPATIPGCLPDYTMDSAEWNQFADLISSGLGNLDAFLSADPFGDGEYTTWP